MEELSEFDLFTGGKRPEFAVFYNVALTRAIGILNYYAHPNTKELQNFTEKAFKTKFEEWITIKKQLPTEPAYHEMANYLWKSFDLRENDQGYALTDLDKKMTAELLLKLYEIRDFHSHAYHDNIALKVSAEFVKFIESMHDRALDKAREKYDTTDYEKMYCGKNARFGFFRDVYPDFFITQEGRAFLLSLFLTKGEMTLFLQQKKGSKRNDKDEFKVKHFVYRYFTHREGSARRWISQEEAMLDVLPEDMKNQVQSARKAYKVLSYLADQPELSTLSALNISDRPGNAGDTTSIFCLKNGTLVHNAMDLIAFCKEYDLFHGVQATEEKGRIHITVDCNGRAFVLDFLEADIKKVALDFFRSSDKRAYNTSFREKLDEWAQSRNHLLDILYMTERSTPHTIEDAETSLFEELESYYKQKLMGGPILREKLGRWIDIIQKNHGVDNAAQFREFVERVRNETIWVSHYDLFATENHKPRSSDKFMLFAVHYLMDWGNTGWEWGFKNPATIEKTEREKNRLLLKLDNEKLAQALALDRETKGGETPTIDVATERERLRISAGLVVYAAQKPQGTRLALKEGQALLRAEDQLFLIGPVAMRNLLIAFLIDGKDIKHFFKPLAMDMKKIGEAIKSKAELPENLELIGSHEMPETMRKALKNSKKTYSNENSIAQARKKINRIIDEVIRPLQNGAADKLSRAEKNRKIMDMYLYYDWKYANNDDFKFLRRHEYQQMSVYHYLLEKHKRNEYGFLIDGIMGHIPQEILLLLNKARDMDGLLQSLCVETTKRLNDWRELLDMRDLPFRKKREILEKLSVTLPDKSLTLNPYMPVPVHPLWVIKKYYKAENEAGGFSLSYKKIRENGLISSLKAENYAWESYSEFLGQHPQKDKITKKLKGSFDRLITEDTLVWHIGQKYLETMMPAWRDALTEAVQAGRNLRETEVKLNLADLTLVLKYHQLDDVLLQESKATMLKIAEHLKRSLPYREEKLKEFDPAKKIENRFKFNIDENLSELPYDDVHKERSRIASEALHWAKYILEWELAAVRSMLSSDLQKWRVVKSGYPRIGFRQVMDYCALTDTLKDLVAKIRNHSFHFVIPEGWCYAELEKNEDLCRLLKYVPKEKHWRALEAKKQSRNLS